MTNSGPSVKEIAARDNYNEFENLAKLMIDWTVLELCDVCPNPATTVSYRALTVWEDWRYLCENDMELFGVGETVNGRGVGLYWR